MENVVHSGFGKRFMAFFLDYFIVSMIGVLLYYIVQTFVMQSLEEGSLSYFMYVTAFFYFILLESSFLQATCGKLIFKIKVVNENGSSLSLLNSVGRFFGKLLSAFILGLGFIMVLFTKNKQGLHDKLANTYVIKIENFEELIEGGAQRLSFMFLKYAGLILLFLIFIFAIISFFSSILNSQFVKDLGNFVAIVLGGIIWAGIFYGGFKIFKAAGGDECYLVSKMFANVKGDFRRQDFKVKQKGDLTSSSHRTKESAINMTKSAQNECLIYYKGTLLGVWDKGQFIREQ